MDYSTLINVLHSANKEIHPLPLPDGTRVLLLPHGGRVLGLFSRGSEDNFYWTHPALRSAETAIALYSSGAWENSGGDRTWLGPELELFFPRYPDLGMSGYFQPRQLDPGAYKVDAQDGRVRLVNRAQLTLFRSKITVHFELAKWVQPTTNPLRYDRTFSGAEVEFCGYEQHTTLELFGDGPGRIGLWNLIQMPHAGRLRISTYQRTEPRLYFGSIPSGDLKTKDHAIDWIMRSAGEQKIGVPAIATTGRVGYVYDLQKEARLVIQNFFVNPAGEYVDVPWDSPNDFGYAVQACNVNSSLGTFSELEYHVPAIGDGTGKTRCEDISQVWAFRGRRTALDEIAQRLLGSA